MKYSIMFHSTHKSFRHCVAYYVENKCINLKNKDTKEYLQSSLKQISIFIYIYVYPWIKSQVNKVLLIRKTSSESWSKIMMLDCLHLKKKVGEILFGGG